MTIIPLQQTVGQAPPIRLIALGASAGGTIALREVLCALPAAFPPVLVVQHILAGFCEMLCVDIGRHSAMKTEIAKDGQKPQPGHIYFADYGRQLTLIRENGGLLLRVGSTERVSGHCPSVDALFSSVAAVAAPEAIGVILTGMGADGAAGLLQMRRAGAYTIGQDEATSVVYGMPKAAFQNGGVTRQFPLNAIAGELIRQVSQRHFC